METEQSDDEYILLIIMKFTIIQLTVQYLKRKKNRLKYSFEVVDFIDFIAYDTHLHLQLTYFSSYSVHFENIHSLT